MKFYLLIILTLVFSCSVFGQNKKPTSKPKSAQKTATKIAAKDAPKLVPKQDLLKQSSLAQEGKPSQQVVVERTNGDRITGLFVSGDSQSITISVSGSNLKISTSEISNLRFRDASSTYESAPRRTSLSNAEIQNLLGQANALYKNDGDDAEALQVLRRVLVDKPMNAEAYLLMGKIHQRRGNMEQAISSFRTAILWDPKLFDSHLSLSKIYLEKKDCPKAKDHLLAALGINSTHQEALALVKGVDQCSQ